MQVFEAIKSLLESQNIPFTTKEHAPTLTSEEASRIRGDALSSGAKAIVYKVQDEFALICVCRQP